MFIYPTEKYPIQEAVQEVEYKWAQETTEMY